jgi:hypothetical protein
MKQAFWEDYQVGDDIPSISKVASTQTLVKCAGASGDFAPFHYEEDFAQSMALKGVIIHGALRRDWLIHLMTNFAGEDGFLKKISCKHHMIEHPRKMKSIDTPLEGETWQCKGKIINKYCKDNEYLFDCEVWIENGKGERTTTGKATVTLPSRIPIN